jgi:hypothetical protein
MAGDAALSRPERVDQVAPTRLHGGARPASSDVTTVASAVNPSTAG